MFFVKLVMGIIAIAYPVLIYFSIGKFSIKNISIFIFIFGCIQFILAISVNINKTTQNKPTSLIIPICIIIISILTYISSSYNWFQSYPILINCSFFILFFKSLFADKTIIQYYAEKTNKNLTNFEIKYIRNVTKAWCIFFILNTSISLFTWLFTNLKVWTIYNGFISYLLIGGGFMFEFAYRYFVITPQVRNNL